MRSCTDSCYATTPDRKWVATLRNAKGEVVRVLHIKARWETHAEGYTQLHIMRHKLDVRSFTLEVEAQ